MYYIADTRNNGTYESKEGADLFSFAEEIANHMHETEGTCFQITDLTMMIDGDDKDAGIVAKGMLEGYVEEMMDSLERNPEATAPGEIARFNREHFKGATKMTDLEEELVIAQTLYGVGVLLFNPQFEKPKVLTPQEIIELGEHFKNNIIELTQRNKQNDK